MFKLFHALWSEATNYNNVETATKFFNLISKEEPGEYLHVQIGLNEQQCKQAGLSN